MNLKILIPAFLVAAGVVLYLKNKPPRPSLPPEVCAVLIDTSVAAGKDPGQKEKLKPELVSDVKSIHSKLHAQFFQEGVSDEELKPLLNTKLQYLYVDDRSTALRPLYELAWSNEDRVVFPSSFREVLDHRFKELIDDLERQNPSQKQGSHYIESLQAAAQTANSILIVGDLAVEEGSNENGIRLETPRENIDLDCTRLRERLAPIVTKLEGRIAFKYEPTVGTGAVIDHNQRILKCWKSALGISDSDMSNGMDSLAAKSRCFKPIAR